MRKQYIIEVDESEIVACWNEQAVKEIGYQEYDLKQCPGIKVKPYNPAGDLISREVLRKAFNERMYYYSRLSWYDANTLINKAPAVEPTYISDIPNDKVKDLQELAIDYDEGLAVFERKRPQGEWVDSPDGLPECCCNLCGAKNVTIWRNFCPNCGADMRGGAE